MNHTSQSINAAATTPAYFRLIALWVLCEAMLGGIIHGLKIPVSGLVVGSCAVVCICLIAWYVPKKGSIIKATVIVAIFKMMLSPQSPPPAYIAVFFQGLMGELLFWRRRMYMFSCILLAVLSLLESGLQRILMLTIVYGNDLWKVVNDFINGLTKQKVTANYSLWIGGGYVFIHFVTGLLVGGWASRLPHRVSRWRKNNSLVVVSSETPVIALPGIKKKKGKIKKVILIIWVLLILLYVQSYFKVGEPLLPSHVSLKILLRSLIIILGWVFIIGPLIKQLLHGWLKKKQTQSQREIQEVLRLLPETQSLVAESWKRSSGHKGIKRIIVTAKMTLVNSLHPGADPSAAGNKIFILAGPVQSGKTTSLVNWCSGRNDVSGILTPVVDGKKVFMDVQCKVQFPMEAADSETEVVKVGRFVFSKAAFEKAIGIIRKSIHADGWLVIDEIGPLELGGRGFHDVLKEVLATRKGKTLLVVRNKEDIPWRVKNYFRLENTTIIKNMEPVTWLQ